jgi:hypothetical protein
VVPNLWHHLSPVTILAQLASGVLDSAYAWLYQWRRDYSAIIGA